MQESLETALSTVLRKAVRLTAAGRTDRGVHAWGQVASYLGRPAQLRSLNAVLPRDISIRACEAAPDGFDARFDAASRIYCYRVMATSRRPAIVRDRVLWWPHRLDRDLLHRCAERIAGLHDFTAFTPAHANYRHYRRTVSRCAWIERGDGALEFWIEADSFLRRMARGLVGAQLEVAGGRRSLDDLVSLLAGAPRAAAGNTAPAHGLYLAAVGYRDAALKTLDFGVAPGFG